MPDLSPGEAFRASVEYRRKYITGYMAFVAALSVAILTLGSDRFPWTWAFPLLVLSLPSLVASLSLQPPGGIEFGSGRRASLGAAYILGFIPSITGICLLVWHFSAIGGAAFAVLCVSWMIVLARVRGSG